MTTPSRFDVLGKGLDIERVEGRGRADRVGQEGKRRPAAVVIPDFVDEPDLAEYLFDLFHESATPRHGSIERVRRRIAASDPSADAPLARNLHRNEGPTRCSSSCRGGPARD